MVIRLHYAHGEDLRLQGFIHVKSNPHYEMTNFLFVNKRGEIVSCCENLSELSPKQSKIHHISEYFNDAVNFKGSNFHDETEYVPLITLQNGDDPVVLFVK
jgi:hypothetical protein